MRKIGIFVLIVILIPLTVQSRNQTLESDLMLNENGLYQLEVIAHSFEYILIDLNAVQIFEEQGQTTETAIENAKLNSSTIRNLEQGRPIKIRAKSADTTHGLLINELGIDFTLLAPQDNRTYGVEIEKIADLPSVDATLLARCNAYCGVGHSEMNFEILVGEGFEFRGGQIDVLGDWRVWLLFGAFLFATGFIVLLSISKPTWIVRGRAD